jgi:hypothetical protein
LVTTNATILLFNFVSLEREDLDWADLYTEKASFTVNLIPEDIQPWLHTNMPLWIKFQLPDPLPTSTQAVPIEGGADRNEQTSILSKPNRIKLPL